MILILLLWIIKHTRKLIMIFFCNVSLDICQNGECESQLSNFHFMVLVDHMSYKIAILLSFERSQVINSY